MRADPHLASVCICTFKRPRQLATLLHKLPAQNTDGLIRLEAVVADNDSAQSARPVVEDFARTAGFPVTYCSQPHPNIALTRNLAIERAQGRYIAFIDDDEFPDNNWLLQLYQTLHQYQAAGALGPVLPYFEAAPPPWLVRGRFCDRPRFRSGVILESTQTRTGNVLFDRQILPAGEPPFRPEFGHGGEDVDFFQRMIGRGCKFVWCDEAVVHELVPPQRWTRSYILKRALLRGQSVVGREGSTWHDIARSFAAVPIYACILPFTLLARHHVFMNLLMRFCDHTGRLLAFLSFKPVQRRHL